MSVSVKLDRAGVGFLQTGDHSQRGRLAAAGWTKQAKKLALLDVERDVGDGARLIESSWKDFSAKAVACFTVMPQDLSGSNRIIVYIMRNHVDALSNGILTSSANLSVPVSQPLAAVFAQQIPVERHSRERLVHPRRQLRAIEVGAHRNAIILVRREARLSGVVTNS